MLSCFYLSTIRQELKWKWVVWRTYLFILFAIIISTVKHHLSAISAWLPASVDVILPRRPGWYTLWQPISDGVYPAGSSLSAHWMCSFLFIHSFPCGQALSLWWIGPGTSHLFSLNGTRSRLKHPPHEEGAPSFPGFIEASARAAVILTRRSFATWFPLEL